VATVALLGLLTHTETAQYPSLHQFCLVIVL